MQAAWPIKRFHMKINWDFIKWLFLFSILAINNLQIDLSKYPKSEGLKLIWTQMNEYMVCFHSQ